MIPPGSRPPDRAGPDPQHLVAAIMPPSNDAAAAAAAAKAAAEAEAARLDAELTAKETANATLHSQAIGVMNIKVLVPMTLEKPANNYGRWRSMFLVVLGKYNLKDHVLSDASYPARSAWATMDCCVLTWIYCTISSDLQQSLMIRDPAARDAWMYLEDEFLGQRESRALLKGSRVSLLQAGRSVRHGLLPPPRDDGCLPQRVRRSDRRPATRPHPPSWPQRKIPTHGVQPKDAAPVPHVR